LLLPLIVFSQELFPFYWYRYTETEEKNLSRNIEHLERQREENSISVSLGIVVSILLLHAILFVEELNKYADMDGVKENRIVRRSYICIEIRVYSLINIARYAEKK
jgi:hypothetical protein